jgi:hypothetical protein
MPSVAQQALLTDLYQLTMAYGYFRLQADDIEYLAGLTGNDGERLFDKAFLDYLVELRLAVTVHGVPARTVVTSTLAASRARAMAQLAGFNAGVKRLANPHQYPVGLERKLHGVKTKLILEARHLEPVRAAAI